MPVPLPTEPALAPAWNDRREAQPVRRNALYLIAGQVATTALAVVISAADAVLGAAEVSALFFDDSTAAFSVIEKLRALPGVLRGRTALLPEEDRGA